MPTAQDPRTRLIAFHLPQFHPIPENDAWWGRGFTEWTNVTKARPLFEGHLQPRLPADLGYYDLRLPEVLEAQADLARSHGVFGFCFHYYWFTGGRRLLERPVEQMLASGKPDFPFCLCWANENWTRRWDGQHWDVLMAQEHDVESDVAFLHGVMPYFRDRRYIRVGGRPLLVVYRATLFPDPAGTVSRWREASRRLGEAPPYLVAAETFDVTSDFARRAGFDATCEFPPHGTYELRLPEARLPRFFAPFSGVLLDYEQVAKFFLARRPPALRRLKTVTLNWDNTARRKSTANVMVNFSLAAYQRWLSVAIDQSARTAPAGERIVFVNAWNEWAEGTYLEPDQLFGHGYLESTRSAVLGEAYQPQRLAWRTVRGEPDSSRHSPGEGTKTPKRTSIIAVAVAGNDEDIIESFVRENLRLVDHLAVLVHDSQDGTRQILRALVAEGVPLRVDADAADADESSPLGRLVLDTMNELRPDWLLLLDTDEFIDSPDRSFLEVALGKVGPNHGRLPWVNHVPMPFDDPSDSHPLRRIRHRYVYESPSEANPRAWKLVLNGSLLRPYLDRYVVDEGGHTLAFRYTGEACRQPVQPLAGVALRHYPVRTAADGEDLVSAHHALGGSAPAAATGPTVRDFLDPGRVSAVHMYGTPIILDPWPAPGELLYSQLLTGDRRKRQNDWLGPPPVIDLERPEERPGPGDSGDPRDCVITLLAGGTRLDEAPLMWRDSLPERLVRDHEQPSIAPPVEVFCLSDLVLQGPGWVGREKGLLFEPSIYPRYCRDWYTSGRIYNATETNLSRLTERRQRLGWHISHFNCGVYGHWLTEVMPKLLVIEEFLRRWPRYASMPILMPSIFPEFVYAHTRTLLPHVPIATYDPRKEYIRCERMFMPTWGRDHVFNPWVGEQVDRIRSAPDPEMPQRIFVSRRSKSVVRALDNQQELESIAMQEGLTIVHPEDYSLPRQIALFRNAAMVVGEFGSALHNAVFSRAGTLVIALNWLNDIQSRIARLKGHRIGYILPTSGAEVLLKLDGTVQHYAIDPVTFRSRLREAMATA
jgi:capsular polysaccharide biosynthesis protein